MPFLIGLGRFLLSLGGWLIGAIGSLVSAEVVKTGKRIALILAAIAVLIALTIALKAALTALISSIAVAAPSQLSLALSWIVPSNYAACASAYFSALILRFAYDFKTKMTTLRSTA